MWWLNEVFEGKWVEVLGRQPMLACDASDIAPATGLSPLQQRLLLQKGAVLRYDSDEKSDAVTDVF